MTNQNPLNFWNAFFGSPNIKLPRYIDNFGNSYNRIFGQKTAIWIDTEESFKHYVEIPELRAVVNKRASMMASNIPCLYDKNGEKVENHWFLDLINKPNPRQNWKDFVFSMSINDALYSNSFAYAPKRSFDIVNLLVPLPSDRITINTTGKKLKQMNDEQLIKNFQFNYDDGKIETFEVDEILYLMTGDGTNLINPVSRMDCLRFPLSNIRASYHKRNVLLENIGSIGILSAKNNDIGGSIPMTPEERKEIQRDWYSRSKDELIITEADVQWQPMSFPTRDLMLFEELNADKLAIVDAYGLNIYVFSQEKGSTFSNVRDGIRMAYTDTIIPETQMMYNNIIEQIGLSDEGYYLEADFSHLPVLQVDENENAKALDTRAAALKKILESGVELSEEEKKEILGL
tara:strand:- start:812 stop:2017 length:1206 start_codon:yes stop_codon:yes gene_type:complete